MLTVWGSDWFSYALPSSLKRGISPTHEVSVTPYGFEDWLLGQRPPTRKALERHRSLFGPDCVYIPKETRSASELRASGLSVREIAHTLGIKERQVQTKLRVEGAA